MDDPDSNLDISTEKYNLKSAQLVGMSLRTDFDRRVVGGTTYEVALS